LGGEKRQKDTRLLRAAVSLEKEVRNGLRGEGPQAPAPPKEGIEKGIVIDQKKGKERELLRPSLLSKGKLAQGKKKKGHVLSGSGGGGRGAQPEREEIGRKKEKGQQKRRTR